jgi:Mitochondrial carrier protein
VKYACQVVCLLVVDNQVHSSHNIGSHTEPMYIDEEIVTLVPCYREEGFANGLYRGIAANLSCSCVQGAAEITTYDFTKETAIKHGFADSMPLHLIAGVPLPQVLRTGIAVALCCLIGLVSMFALCDLDLSRERTQNSSGCFVMQAWLLAWLLQ